MRQVLLRVDDEQLSAAIDVLEEYNVDYVVTDADDAPDRGTLVIFPLPTQAVSTVFDELHDAGLDEDTYTIVTSAEFISTENYDELRQEHTSAVQALPRAEFHAKVREMKWPRLTYYLGTVLSVVVATAGLLLDSPALVIGAMVIAPQVTSALAASTGSLLGDWDMFVDSFRRQSVGLGLAIAGAAMFGAGVRWAGFVPPSMDITRLELMGLRLAPSSLSTAGAIAAGVVGAFGFTTEQSTSLVGVMIAAALIPAAAAVGLGVAWAAPLAAVGALLLLLTNLFAINVGAFVTLVLMGYRLSWRGEERSIEQTIRDVRKPVLVAVVVVLAAAFVGTAALSGQHMAFEQQATESVERTFEETPYRNLTLKRVSMQYAGFSPVGGAPEVIVRVSRSSNVGYPELGRDIQRRIETSTGQDVRVSVQYEESTTTRT